MGGARKWPENEATVLKIGGLVASFPGHVGGARKWPENEATVLKIGGLVASFPGHVGGARKWPEKLGSGAGKEDTAMNWQSRL